MDDGVAILGYRPLPLRQPSTSDNAASSARGQKDIPVPNGRNNGAKVTGEASDTFPRFAWSDFLSYRADHLDRPRIV